MMLSHHKLQYSPKSGARWSDAGSSSASHLEAPDIPPSRHATRYRPAPERLGDTRGHGTGDTPQKLREMRWNVNVGPVEASEGENNGRINVTLDESVGGSCRPSQRRIHATHPLCCRTRSPLHLERFRQVLVEHLWHLTASSPHDLVHHLVPPHPVVYSPARHFTTSLSFLALTRYLT